MRTARIIVSTTPKIKKAFSKFAKDNGMTMTWIIEQALRKLLKDKHVRGN